MKRSIFASLCDLVDEFDTYVRTLPLGPETDRLSGLVRRFDDVIDRTIGLEVEQPRD